MTAVPSEPLVCSVCGKTFEMSQALKDKYPGWAPRKCPRCYSKNASSGAGHSKQARRPNAGPFRSKSTGSSTSATEQSQAEAIPVHPGQQSLLSDHGHRTRDALGDTLTKTTDGKKERPLPKHVEKRLKDAIKNYRSGPSNGVFTDGGCSGNPGPGGWGAILVRGGKLMERRYGFDPKTTNNRMELTALTAGFELIRPDEDIVIWSDSELCVKTINIWAASWERNGWKRKTGPIKNLDLVKPLYHLARSRPKAKLQWIKAHDGSLWNEYVDILSTAFIS